MMLTPEALDGDYLSFNYSTASGIRDASQLLRVWMSMFNAIKLVISKMKEQPLEFCVYLL
jgi:hypothetical protein